VNKPTRHNLTTQRKYTLKYKSSRKDVWVWYRKIWLKKFWKMHAVLAFSLVFFIAIVSDRRVTHAFTYLVSFVVVFLIISLLSAIFPQLMFKSSQRTLVVDANGWSTVVGKKEGTKNWNKVQHIKNKGGKVILRMKNNNAFIIPDYAFSDDANREQFIKDALYWKSEYEVKN
jgi:hypothetical protein